jgi:hypothetical protein
MRIHIPSKQTLVHQKWLGRRTLLRTAWMLSMHLCEMHYLGWIEKIVLAMLWQSLQCKIQRAKGARQVPPHIHQHYNQFSGAFTQTNCKKERVTGMAESAGQVLPAKKCLWFLVVSFQTAATLVSFQEKVALVTTLLLILLWITLPIRYRDTVSTALTVETVVSL